MDIYARRYAMSVLLDKGLVCKDSLHNKNIYGFKHQYIPVKSTYEVFHCNRNKRYTLLNGMTGEFSDFQFFHVRIGQKLPYMKEYVRKVRNSPVP